MRQFKPEGSVWSRFSGIRKSIVDSCIVDGSIIEAPAAKCDDEMNLHFELGLNIYGILPFSELEYSHDNKPTKEVAVINRVAKSTCFKIISAEEDENGNTRVMLSRKAAQKECYDEYISKLQVGQVIDARITRLESYGAFCDIGCGIIALLPMEHFCVTRIKEPKTALKQFKNIKVVVKSIDNGRIILSHKELLGTWEEEAAKFNVGDIVAGIVRVVESYGAFIELTPNLAGLCEPVDGIKSGDVVSVTIKGIIPEKMKIKLAVTDTENTIRPYVKLDYRIPEDGFVRNWKYSPDVCPRVIETNFD